MSGEAPSKEERDKCYKSRDLFWKCLDDSQENLEKCKASRDLYEKDCSKAWVYFFYFYLKKKKL